MPGVDRRPVSLPVGAGRSAAELVLGAGGACRIGVGSGVLTELVWNRGCRRSWCGRGRGRAPDWTTRRRPAARGVGRRLGPMDLLRGPSPLVDGAPARSTIGRQLPGRVLGWSCRELGWC